MSTTHFGLPDDYSDGLTPYTGPQISRVHRLLDATANTLKVIGAGIVTKNQPNSFLVTAATGLNVSIAAGSGIAVHSTKGATLLLKSVPTTLLLPANATRYIFAAIEATGLNDSQETGLPTFVASASNTMDGGVLLASVTTGAASVTGVTDLRESLSKADWPAISNKPAVFPPDPDSEVFDERYYTRGEVDASQPTCRVYNTTSVSLANTGAWQQLNFQAVEAGMWPGMWDVATPGNIKVPFTRYYEVGLRFMPDAFVGYLRVRLDAGTVIIDEQLAHYDATGYRTFDFLTHVPLVQNDVLKFFVFHNANPLTQIRYGATTRPFMRAWVRGIGTPDAN